jgi:alpha-beta hydrolase superfamily lysophospholipase
VFESSGYRIAAHVWSPANPKGSVFVLHGYLDHTGLLKPLISYLLDCGLAVAAYDLPGHGLSSGERGAINDFSEYATVFNDFLRICRPHLARPHHEYLHTTEDADFDKVVFLAPLVHSAHWKLSKAGTFVAAPFLDTLPRMFRANTSDAAYLSFVQEDPLRILEVPIRWTKALYSWDERIHGYGRIEQPVLVVQGTDDDIVDWEYNISFLKGRVNPIDVKWVVGAKHQLVNERSDLRAQVLSLIRGYLDPSRD